MPAPLSSLPPAFSETESRACSDPSVCGAWCFDKLLRTTVIVTWGPCADISCKLSDFPARAMITADPLTCIRLCASHTFADVVFYGLSIVQPLVSPQSLEHPSLATEFFGLLGWLIETYPHKVGHELARLIALHFGKKSGAPHP